MYQQPEPEELAWDEELEERPNPDYHGMESDTLDLVRGVLSRSKKSELLVIE